MAQAGHSRMQNHMVDQRACETLRFTSPEQKLLAPNYCYDSTLKFVLLLLLFSPAF